MFSHVPAFQTSKGSQRELCKFPRCEKAALGTGWVLQIWPGQRQHVVEHQTLTDLKVWLNGHCPLASRLLPGTAARSGSLVYVHLLSNTGISKGLAGSAHSSTQSSAHHSRCLVSLTALSLVSWVPDVSFLAGCLGREPTARVVL